MNRPVLVLWDAEQDIAEIAQWYDGQGSGLGADFLDDVGRVVGRLSRWPDCGPLVGIRTRRVLLARFPYLLLDVSHQEQVEITAVCHQSRHPRRWNDRVQEPAPHYAAA